ncbi:MAG TPA: hypothetical protein VMT85_25250 [Thermoanaerobaculia bacterium]|nr:hypothetical protein [Thermoanaerobaculia bacterium]
MSPSEPNPTISVLILVGALRHRAERCPAAVLEQPEPPHEVLVLDVAPEARPLAGSDHPVVRRIPLRPETELGSLGWTGSSSAGFTRLELNLPREPADLAAGRVA